MNREQARKQILEQCDDPDGVLLQLRTRNFFSIEKFNKLKASITEYAEALGDEDLISREVMGCVFLLVQVLESTMQHYENVSHPDKSHVADAHAELWNLILESLSK